MNDEFFMEKAIELSVKAVENGNEPFGAVLVKDGILFLGNSYYAFTIDPEVRAFIRSLDKEIVGRIVNFGSAAMMNSTIKKVRAEASKIGIPVDSREFHCKGEFKGVHKGKPDENDLKNISDFAKGIISDKG